jgi:hypothetical protein
MMNWISENEPRPLGSILPECVHPLEPLRNPFLSSSDAYHYNHPPRQQASLSQPASRSSSQTSLQKSLQPSSSSQSDPQVPSQVQYPP